MHSLDEIILLAGIVDISFKTHSMTMNSQSKALILEYSQCCQQNAFLMNLIRKQEEDQGAVNLKEKKPNNNMSTSKCKIKGILIVF